MLLRSMLLFSFSCRSWQQTAEEHSTLPFNSERLVARWRDQAGKGRGRDGDDGGGGGCSTEQWTLLCVVDRCGQSRRAQADRSVLPGTQPTKKRSESSQACEEKRESALENLRGPRHERTSEAESRASSGAASCLCVDTRHEAACPEN